jgi:hypothetical protein
MSRVWSRYFFDTTVYLKKEKAGNPRPKKKKKK